MLWAKVWKGSVLISKKNRREGFARSNGALATVNARQIKDVIAHVVEITGGGAHVSVDALGSPVTCFNSIANLRKRGKHVQVGLISLDESAEELADMNNFSATGVRL